MSGKFSKTYPTSPERASSINPNKRRTAALIKKANSSRRVSVDIVTGREAVHVYFDPTVIIDTNVSTSDEWLGDNLYCPAAIVKQDDNSGVLTVRLKNGEVYKVPQRSAVKVNPQDEDGVDDILRLQEFSEMSLLHTLRVRYFKDDIYTFAGPILISINPYKWTTDLYRDELMVQYHKQSQVGSLR